MGGDDCDEDSDGEKEGDGGGKDGGDDGKEGGDGGNGGGDGGKESHSAGKHPNNPAGNVRSGATQSKKRRVRPPKKPQHRKNFRFAGHSVTLMKHLLSLDKASSKPRSHFHQFHLALNQGTIEGRRAAARRLIKSMLASMPDAHGPVLGDKEFIEANHGSKDMDIIKGIKERFLKARTGANRSTGVPCEEKFWAPLDSTGAWEEARDLAEELFGRMPSANLSALPTSDEEVVDIQYLSDDNRAVPNMKSGNEVPANAAQGSCSLRLRLRPNKPATIAENGVYAGDERASPDVLDLSIDEMNALPLSQDDGREFPAEIVIDGLDSEPETSDDGYPSMADTMARGKELNAASTLSKENGKKKTSRAARKKADATKNTHDKVAEHIPAVPEVTSDNEDGKVPTDPKDVKPVIQFGRTMEGYGGAAVARGKIEATRLELDKGIRRDKGKESLAKLGT